MEDNVKFGTECPGNDCLRTDGFICGPDSCGIADGRAEFLCADLARPTLTQALAMPEVAALVEAASQLSRAVDSSFYPEDRGGYETVEQVREVHAKEREVAIQTYVGARDAEEALAMSHHSALSVIRGAKARINDMLTDLNTALTAINNKV